MLRNKVLQYGNPLSGQPVYRLAHPFMAARAIARGSMKKWMLLKLSTAVLIDSNHNEARAAASNDDWRAPMKWPHPFLSPKDIVTRRQ